MNKLSIFLIANLCLFTQVATANHDPLLTTIGAEQSGNADGSIPPWSGGVSSPPAAYKPGDWHPNPFVDDPILFTINIKNVAQFKNKLSAGHIAMIEKYPATYGLNIYPTRRSASHPLSVLKRTIESSGKARIVDDGAGITGILLGVPFPHPENGAQAMWNARLSYKAGGHSGYLTNTRVSDNGAYDMTVYLHEVKFPYSDIKTTFDNFHNIKSRRFLRTLRPAKGSGQLILIHRFLNNHDAERRVWVYSPAKRRVKRDNNGPYGMAQSASDGITLWDQVGMWRGPITDFNWTLIGKRETYIPYNAYQLHSGEITVDDIIEPGHINQQLVRYELHRVWVVEANLKEAHTHLYKKRRYYIDEDSWRIVLAEHFDEQEGIDRFSESHNINYYEVPVVLPTLDTFYKLDTARYYVQHIDNQYSPLDFTFDQKASYYSPGRLKMKAKR